MRRFPSMILQVHKSMFCGLVINVLFNYNLLPWRKPPILLLCNCAIWKIKHSTIRCPDHEQNSPLLELNGQRTAVGFFAFSSPTWQPIQCSFPWSKLFCCIKQMKEPKEIQHNINQLMEIHLQLALASPSDKNTK